MSDLSRRELLSALPVFAVGSNVLVASDLSQAPPDAALKHPPAANGIGAAYPSHDPAIVQELVGASHGNLARVKELVTRQPALAKVSWDWAYGDWESALGAASHVGNRPIAEFLIENGAPPTIFSAAMLGQLDVVKSLITSTPGLARHRGPHGITLLAHARAGGEAASPVLKYLETVDGADERPKLEPLAPADRALLPGRYDFGSGPRDYFVIDEVKDQVGIVRAGATRRNLLHLGDLTFYPIGVEAVRVRFQRAGDRIVSFTIADPDVQVTARKA